LLILVFNASRSISARRSDRVWAEGCLRIRVPAHRGFYVAHLTYGRQVLLVEGKHGHLWPRLVSRRVERTPTPCKTKPPMGLTEMVADHRRRAHDLVRAAFALLVWQARSSHPGDRTRVLPTSQVQPFPGQGPVYSRGEQPSRVPQPTTSIVQTETHHVYRCIADGRLVYYRADALRKASLAFGPPLMLNYKGFPLRSSDSRAWRVAQRRIKGDWPPCQCRALRATRVRTAGLQPVIVQRSLLRTLMEDARRGSIR